MQPVDKFYFSRRALYTRRTFFYSPVSSSLMLTKRMVSNVSSPFFVGMSRAPTPSINSLSVAGMCHAIDSGRRCAINANIRSESSSAPNCLQGSDTSGSSSRPTSLLSIGRTRRRARTGWNENQRPNAVQNGVSSQRLRILYEITTFKAGRRDDDTQGGAVRCMSVRKSGPRSSGEYTCEMHVE